MVKQLGHVRITLKIISSLACSFKVWFSKLFDNTLNSYNKSVANSIIVSNVSMPKLYKNYWDRNQVVIINYDLRMLKGFYYL